MISGASRRERIHNPAPRETAVATRRRAIKARRPPATGDGSVNLAIGGADLRSAGAPGAIISSVWEFMWICAGALAHFKARGVPAG